MTFEKPSQRHRTQQTAMTVFQDASQIVESVSNAYTAHQQRRAVEEECATRRDEARYALETQRERSHANLRMSSDIRDMYKQTDDPETQRTLANALYALIKGDEFGKKDR
ncbi:MAG TPA: hypothetical protein DCE42_29235 [Myxococcales bacterium]|nr:hypothetical protein [Myxococcales bacterium]